MSKKVEREKSHGLTHTPKGRGKIGNDGPINLQNLTSIALEPARHKKGEERFPRRKEI